MIKSFEKNIDDLKFQNELGVTETIKSNINEDFNKTDELVDYFNQFDEDLSKKNLNSFSKSVINE